jgi:glycosyltransferase involved in cell wall biosynthesis
MVDIGWEADVILSVPYEGWNDPFTLDGVNVIPFTDKRQIIHAANNSQVLISHLENSVRVSMVSKIYRVPNIQVIHNNMTLTRTYLDHGCDLAVFNTNWVANDMLNYWNGPYVVVHPMFDPERFPYKRAKGEYITLVNLWNGHPSKTGVMSDGKGTNVFYEMANRFPGEKFLAIPGGYGIQDIRTDLPNVTIGDHTNDMAKDVYHKSKLVLMPSRYESFGRVASEAALCGVPSVVSTTPGLQEAFSNAGIYAEPDNYDQWESQIRYALDNWSNVRKAQREQINKFVRDQDYEFAVFNDAATELATKTLRVRGY